MGCLNEREYPFVFSRVFEMMELDEDFDEDDDDQPRETKRTKDESAEESKGGKD